MRRFAHGSLALALAALVAAGPLAACESGSPASARGWRPAACWFDTGTSRRVGCGYLTVPLHHDRPDGRTIELAVEVIHAPSLHPRPDPVVVLAGGPAGTLVGNRTSMLTGYAPTHLLAGRYADRDLVVLDQRGAGHSRPSLDCAPVVDVGSGLACRDRLVARGIDLTAYTMEEDAADVAALGPALGYRSVNLFGYSHGSLLALTVMRAHPSRVRSAILASPVPPQASVFTDLPDNTARALEALFDSCAQDPRCGAAYPRLARDLRTAVDLLDAHPRRLLVHVDGTEQAVRLDGRTLVGLLSSALYLVNLAGLPRAIHHAATGGDLSDWAEIVADGSASTEDLGPTGGTSWSILCTDEVPFADPRRARARDVAHPEQHHLFAMPAWWFDLCARWPRGRVSDVGHTPVRSDIPTLIVTGQYDPANPPAYGRLIAETLSRGYFTEFPGQGHIPDDPCVESVEIDFLHQPRERPDTSCTQRTPSIPWKTD